MRAAYLNHYQCPLCDYEWTDEWACQSDDDCPNCGKSHVMPYYSEDLEDEDENQ